MTRYEIDTYRASGSKALYVLGALELARCIAAQRSLPSQSSALIDELIKHQPAIFKQELKDKRAPDFAAYFSPPQSANIVQLRSNSDAFTFLADFVLDKIGQLPDATQLNLPRNLKQFIELLDKDIPFLHASLCPAKILNAAHPWHTWRSPRFGEVLGVPAFSIPSIKLALLYLSVKCVSNNPEAGAFYVLREARGVSSATSDQATVIVREVLWIRCTDPAYFGKKGEAYGYYFSPVDSSIYVITGVSVIDDGQLQLFGRKLLENGRLAQHHFYLTMPTANGANRTELHRPALVCGSTSRARSPAAWKVAVLRLAPTRAIEKVLETVMAQDKVLRGKSADHLAEYDSTYDRAMVALDYLQTNGHVGLLASHALANRSAARALVLTQLRHALKHLLRSNAEPIIDKITKQLFFDLLDERARSAISKLRADPRTRHRFDRALVGILGSWRMLDNASIFVPTNFRAGSAEEQARNRAFIQQLLDATIETAEIEIKD